MLVIQNMIFFLFIFHMKYSLVPKSLYPTIGVTFFVKGMNGHPDAIVKKKFVGACSTELLHMDAYSARGNQSNRMGTPEDTSISHKEFLFELGREKEDFAHCRTSEDANGQKEKEEGSVEEHYQVIDAEKESLFDLRSDEDSTNCRASEKEGVEEWDVDSEGNQA
jgi:hypothetical protein